MRGHPDTDPEDVQLRVVTQTEQHEQPVSGAEHEHQEHPAQEGDAERGPGRRVTWAVGQVVKFVVAGEPTFDPGEGAEYPEHDEREQHATPERVGHQREMADRHVKARHQAQGADQPAEVPVGLGPVGAQPRLERPPLPDRVDLDQAAEQEQHAGHDEHQRQRAQRLAGNMGTPTIVARVRRLPETGCGGAP